MNNFIPKQYKNEQITIRIPEPKLETINKLAAESNLSRNKFINQCIDYAIENMQKIK